MSKKLITTTSVVFALAAAGGASTAFAANNTTPASPGACNMLHTSDTGLTGMMNDPHVFDIMIPLVVASLDAGCVHP
jgi:hypothetical protein